MCGTANILMLTQYVALQIILYVIKVQPLQ
jgi:hypothetical protein